MKVSRIVLLALAWSFCLSAAAQWMWLDNAGRKVFSDRGPPADVPSQRILKSPGGAAQVAATAPTTASAANAAASAAGPKVKTTEPALETKKKQAEQAEQAKAKAAEEETKKLRADSCLQGRKGMDLLNSGARLRVLNAKGELEVMDDTMRAAESTRIQKIIDTDCAA